MMEWPTGQERRAWLDRKGQAALDAIQYYLGPGVNVGGIATIADALNPIGDMTRAGTAARGAVQPGIGPMERLGYVGSAATDMASVLAPVVGAAHADDAARGLTEALANWSMPADDAAARFLADDYGGLNYTRRPDAYAGSHRAPGRDGYSAPLDNLAGEIYPDDIYSPQAWQYYGHGERALDQKTAQILQRYRGKPDAEVTIYRAVPKGQTDINAGDWVTVNRDYARQHGESWLDGEYDIIAEKVRAGDLFTDGNSIHEFGWDPLPRR